MFCLNSVRQSHSIQVNYASATESSVKQFLGDSRFLISTRGMVPLQGGRIRDYVSKLLEHCLQAAGAKGVKGWLKKQNLLLYAIAVILASSALCVTLAKLA